MAKDNSSKVAEREMLYIYNPPLLNAALEPYGGAKCHEGDSQISSQWQQVSVCCDYDTIDGEQVCVEWKICKQMTVRCQSSIAGVGSYSVTGKPYECLTECSESNVGDLMPLQEVQTTD